MSQTDPDIAPPYARIAVIGAGAWGTALALVAAGAGRETTLWAREAEVVASINDSRENTRFLPGVAIPPALKATGVLAECAAAEAVLIVAPAQHLRATMAALGPLLAADTPVVICAKGIELATGRLLTEVLGETALHVAPAVLSGPSFARDVAIGLPTAVAVAAELAVARRLQATLARPVFRPYASDDLIGVALGGAAKNVYAIGCGLADGYGLGESARAALLARSFAELLRLGAVLGARAETLMGLAGLGDLALTATSRTSRNFEFGYRLASGEAQSGAQPLAEGAATSSAILARAEAEGVALPVAQAVHDVLTGAKSGQEAIASLLTRQLRDE